MWKNRLAYGLVLLTAAVLLFLYSKSFLLSVLIVLLLLMVINGMRVRPGGQQGKDVNLNITVNSDKKLLAAGQYTASLKPLEGRIGTTVISAVSGGKLQHIAVGGGCEVVELPAERIEDEVYRILC